MGDNVYMQKPMKHKPESFGKVAVLMGGLTAEREISLQSGNNVLCALKKQGIDAYAIDVTENIVKQLDSCRPDRAFILLHGRGGEDGVIQALLELLKIPYTGSGVGASALCMDKIRCKWLWQSAGLLVPPFVKLADNMDFDKASAAFDLPLCVKPTKQGSSFGVSKITDRRQLSKAYHHAKQYDEAVILEPWIEGRELTVAILGDKTLPTIEIQPKQAFFDYDAKYVLDTTRFICPCSLTDTEQEEIKRLSLQAFYTAGCCHWGRADIIQDAEGRFWLLEMNTIPGMTSHSLVPMAAKAAGMSFEQLVVDILSYTLPTSGMFGL